MNISSRLGINSVSSVSMGSDVDSEEVEIMRRLLAYGITPTGNKTTDKARLHEIELRHAKQEVESSGGKCVNSNKFFTVSKVKLEEMARQIKEKRKTNNAEDDEDTKALKKATENQTGATQESILNQYFYVKKKKSLRS